MLLESINESHYANDIRVRCDLKAEAVSRIELERAFLYFLSEDGGWTRPAGRAEMSRGESYYDEESRACRRNQIN